MAKKQHYVPQFLLRNWSKDNSSISVFLTDLNKRISNAPINSQAQKQYYYEKDQKIESLFSQIENEASVIINDIIKGKRKLTAESKNILLHFVAIQNVRTPGQIEKIDDSITQLAKNALSKSKKLNGKQISSVQVKLNNTGFWQLCMYVQSFLLYADLRIAFLKSSEKNNFVIGQNPIIITNKFLIERNWSMSKKGLGMKGATIFFAILSKRHALFI